MIPPASDRAEITISAMFAPVERISAPLSLKQLHAVKITMTALFIKCIKTDGSIDPERTATNENAQPAINWYTVCSGEP